MFVGSINSKIRDLIYTEKEKLRGTRVCVGCSGNFTVEQILYVRFGRYCRYLYAAGKNPPEYTEIIDGIKYMKVPEMDDNGVPINNGKFILISEAMPYKDSR